MSRLVDNLLIFGRILRGAGFDVHAERLGELARALAYVDIGARDEVYHACRALVVRRHDQIPIFDVAFAAFWREHHDTLAGRHSREERAAGPRASAVQIEHVFAPEALDAPGAAAPGVAPGLKAWSDADTLASKDLAALTSEELAEARAALARLVWQPGARRTRRWARGRGSRIDLRRAIAQSVRSGGDVVRLPRRTRRVRPRPLVLLCDVSGSMERYSRMLLHFAQALTQRHRRVETFLFSTRLTRVTRALRVSGPDQAISTASSIAGWGGGTRIGAAVKDFHQQWSRRVLHGGPVVLLISDGWDRGDPEELGRQIARLQRSCHRLIWLNPLIGTVGYSPLTRGLRAALPFVDDFLPVRTLTNIAQLALHLNALA